MKKTNWDADLSLDDCKFLIEILQEWEQGGECSKLEFIQSLKSISIPDILPDELREHIEPALEKVKKDMLPQEREVKHGAEVRREKATLLRAKLIILSQSLTADKLTEFDEAEDKGN